MSSFIVCYPDIPANAMVVTTSATMSEIYPIENTFYGERWAFSERATAGTSLTITYDLGTGITRAVDHFIVAGCQSLRANSVTECRLQGSTDGTTWVDQLGTAANFLTRTFMGPDGDDVIFTSTVNTTFVSTLTAYRYWRVVMSSAASHTFSVSKIYFGTSAPEDTIVPAEGYASPASEPYLSPLGESYLPPGASTVTIPTREPDFCDLEVLTERDSDTWRYPRGHVIMAKAFYPKHRFTIEWDGMSDSVARSMCTALLSNPFKNHVFLYTGTHHDPLYENRLVHARVVADSCKITRKRDTGDWVNVSMVFEEL